MQVIRSNNVVCFDCDDTLVMWKTSRLQTRDSMYFLYGDEAVWLTPHRNHIRFLKHCYDRGNTVIVWSKNGYQWAEKIVDKLGLQEYVHIILSKPTAVVDDKDALNDIVGERIYLPE